MEIQTAVQPKTFYTRATGLALRITMGEHVRVGEKLERINEKIVQFSPFGAGEYGSLETNDPETIAKLEARSQLPGSDVMTAEQFNEQLIPAAQKIEALRNDNDRQDREIQEKNRIIAELTKNQKPTPQTVRQ